VEIPKAALGSSEGEDEALGLTASYHLSLSRNGRNKFINNVLRAHCRLAPWASVRMELPYTYLETVQIKGTERHEFFVDGFGDMILSGALDLAALWGKSVASAVKPVVEPDSAETSDEMYGFEEEEPEAPRPKPPAESDGLHVLLGLDLKLPTGKCNHYYLDPLTSDRVYFPLEAQIGRGIFRPEFSVSLYRGFGAFFPLVYTSYSIGRFENSTGTLLSDILTIGAGALAQIDRRMDLRFTAMLVSIFNVHNIRQENPGAADTVIPSRGWLLFMTLDVSGRIYKGLSFMAGTILPLGKTLDESPNDMDFLIKGGLKFEF
jgi:hypothetical protein